MKYNSKDVLSGTLGLCLSEHQSALPQSPPSAAEEKWANKALTKNEALQFGAGFLEFCFYCLVSWFGVLFFTYLVVDAELKEPANMKFKRAIDFLKA